MRIQRVTSLFFLTPVLNPFALPLSCLPQSRFNGDMKTYIDKKYWTQAANEMRRQAGPYPRPLSSCLREHFCGVRWLSSVMEMGHVEQWTSGSFCHTATYSAVPRGV